MKENLKNYTDKKKDDLTSKEINLLTNKLFMKVLEAKKNGDKEKEDSLYALIYELNEKYVYHCVRKYYASYVGTNDIEDIYQCARIGMLVGMQQYDPTKGFVFTTFITYYMKSEISNYINTKNGLTTHHATNIKKVKKAMETLEQRGISQEDQSPIQIAEIAGISIECVYKALDNIEKSNVKYLNEIENCEDKFVSITDNPETIAMKTEEQNILAKAIGRLSELEQEVIKVCFYDNDKITDKKAADIISEELGITVRSEDLKTIRMKAIKKLAMDRDIDSFYGTRNKKRFLDLYETPICGEENAENILNSIEDITIELTF